MEVVIVSCAAHAGAERSRAIDGSPGRYMSIDRGPKADSAPSSTTSRRRLQTALPTADEGMPTLHGDEVSPASVDGRVAPGVRAGTRGCGGGGGAPARGACGGRA